MAVLVGWSPFVVSPATLVAAAASLGATFGYAVGLTYSRRRFAGQRPLTVAFGQLLGASLLLAPGALLTVPRQLPPVDTTAAVVGLGLICTAIGWPLLFRLVAAIGPTASSTVTFLVPVFGLAWGTLFLGEPLSSGMFLGAALILVSVVLVLGVRIPWPAPLFIARPLVRPQGSDA